MSVARAIGLVLQLAPARPGSTFSLASGSDVRLRARDDNFASVNLGTGDLKFGLDLGQSISLGETAGGSGRSMGRSSESVPAPKIAVA